MSCPTRVDAAEAAGRGATGGVRAGKAVGMGKEPGAARRKRMNACWSCTNCSWMRGKPQWKMSWQKGKKNELMILLDNNEDRSVQAASNGTKAVKSSNMTLDFDTAVGNLQGSKAKVQINTLSPYTGFGGGIYKMSVVKRMTAKDDFLKMELKDRKCEVELYEDCRTRKLFEECNCVPWELSRFQVEFL